MEVPLMSNPVRAPLLRQRFGRLPATRPPPHLNLLASDTLHLIITTISETIIIPAVRLHTSGSGIFGSAPETRQMRQSYKR